MIFTAKSPGEARLAGKKLARSGLRDTTDRDDCLKCPNNSGVFLHTELEHTRKNVYQHAVKLRDSFHSWRTGDGYGGVFWGCPHSRWIGM